MSWTATNSEGYPAPVGLTVDVAVLTVNERGLVALSLKGPNGQPALPGGFVKPEQDPAEAAKEMLASKTAFEGLYIEQLGAFAQPGRDPRGWIPAIGYVALVPGNTEPGDDARWLRARDSQDWAYDHKEILALALDRVEGKLWWSNVAVGILPPVFSMSQARHVYEAIAGRTYDPATFARDLKATGLVQATGESRSEGPGRPAALFKFNSSDPSWGAGRRKRVGPEPKKNS